MMASTFFIEIAGLLEIVTLGDSWAAPGLQWAFPS
jgi:hypothetical protein